MPTIESQPTPETTAILRQIVAAQPEPAADLWARIEVAHDVRVRWRRWRRLAGGGVLGLALVGAFLLHGTQPMTSAPERGTEIDWQARAQALELQLLAIEHDDHLPIATAVAFRTDPATSELAEIDRRLQAVYEHKSDANQLVPLWKRRSELLDTLIAARKEQLTLIRI